MELKEFAGELKVRMKAAIDGITADQPDVVIRNSRLICSIESFVSELKRFVLKYKFRNPNEEIEFFKSIKPAFMSELWYHKRLYKIHLFESYNPGKNRLKYYQKQLHKLRAIMSRHNDFYQYVYSNADQMDDKYFSRSCTAKWATVLDDRFSTPFDIQLSKLLCNEKVKEYLVNAINKIESPESTPSNSTLKWTGSKTDLIELIYALQATEVFNKGNAGIKQIASEIEIMFNVSLGNYYRVFQDIRLRKTGQVNFLEELKQRLIKRMDSSDI
jgi:hypothetical protein